ncbi:MAG: hypothetical protein LBV72_06130 [Tannerella sp.]|jgi:hypothetical protein|nr:hypothetical protein [Tannerella sp.]
MGTKQNKLDELKGTNPFKLPEGYMEGLTDQIMSKLPEIPKEEAPEVSLLDRVRPWLYMAAVFVGLLLMFKGFSFIQTDKNSSGTDETTYQSATLNKNIFVDSEEDLEYLEYLENEYLNGAFSEMMANAE